jgi:hypothetical protein
MQHFLGLFAALNPGKLVHGDKTKKLECALASLDSMSGTATKRDQMVGFHNLSPKCVLQYPYLGLGTG